MKQATPIDDLLADIKPGVERALVATFGLDLGLDAAAFALAAGWERAERLLDMENPGGYLFTIGKNFAKSNFREPACLPPVEDGPAPHIEPGLPDALAGLSAQQRRAVILVHGFGYTYAEVAAILDVSVSSVRNHLRRGMKKLRRELGVRQ